GSPASTLVLVEVSYEDGNSESYFLPLGVSFGSAAESIRSTSPAAVVCEIVSEEGAGVLHEAVLQDEMCMALLACIENRQEIRTRKAVIRGVPSSLFDMARGPAE